MLTSFLRPAVALVLAGLFLAPVGRAQTTTELTLERVLGEIESVNLSVLSNREFINQAQQNVVLARSGFLPQLNVRASQTRANQTRTGVGDVTGNSFTGTLSASMTVIDLQQRRTLLAARQGIAVSKLDYEDAVQAVLASVASLYFEHVRNIAFDQVIDSNIDRAQVLLNLARNQLQAGVATQIDVTRAEAELVTQQQAKLAQQSVIVNSALRIKELLNLDLGTEIKLDDFRVKRELDPALKNLTLDDVLGRRADYRAATAALDQARLQTEAAGAGRLPTFAVTGSAGVDTEVFLDGNEQEFWSAGVQMNMPIFEGNRIRADERIAASRERQQEFQLSNLRNQIGAELRNSQYDVASQIAQIEVAEKNLTLAEEELRLARVRYEQGVADNRELIDAENRYTQASFNLVNAQYSYHVARVEFARVRGDVRLILSEKTK